MFQKLILKILGLFFIAPHFDVPGTPGTLASIGASALQRTLYDNHLRMDNTLDEIWDKVAESVDIKNDKIEKIPESIFTKFPQVPRGTWSMKLQMTTPYKEAPREGSDELMLGYEEDEELYHMPLYWNDIKKSTKALGWGIQFEAMNATGVYQMTTQKYQKYWKELRGRRIREASMLTVEGALTKAPHATTVRQQFCSNIFIPNLAIGDMPVWDVTDLTVTAGSADTLGYYPNKTFSGADTYIESIADKMLTASGTGASSLAYLGVENLDDLIHWLKTYVKMPPITIGGKSGYIFVIPEEVAAYLANPNRSGTMGSLYKDITQLSKEEIEYGGILGSYKCLWFKVDSRGPTLTVGGSSGSYTLRPGFVNPGNNDDRNLSPWSATSGSLNYVFDVGFVYGAGGLGEAIIVPPQYAKESTEYGQIVGKGSYQIGGIQTIRYDVDTPDDDTGNGKTLIQRSVAMVLMSRIAATTIRT